MKWYRAHPPGGARLEFDPPTMSATLGQALQELTVLVAAGRVVAANKYGLIVFGLSWKETHDQLLKMHYTIEELPEE